MSNKSKDTEDRNIYSMKFTPVAIPPYNWLKETTVYNKSFEKVPYEWIEYNADTIVAFFSSEGVEYKGFVTKFYETYENAKLVNLPIEVIYIPMDETEEGFKRSFEEQANWFTLNFNDQLIPVLKYMYGITSLPHLMVLRVDGTIISSYGLVDLEEYGKNVLITWLSSSSSNKTHRRLSKETMYGPTWRYLASSSNKADYQRRFSSMSSPTDYQKRSSVVLDSRRRSSGSSGAGNPEAPVEPH